MANRLSEDPANEVLLLEYGGPAASPMISIPRGFSSALRGDERI